MSTYAHILKNWELHKPKKVFTDVASVCFEIDSMFYYHNDKTYFEDGSFRNLSMNIIDDKDFVKENNNKQFILNIQGVNMNDIAVGLDKDLDYLVPHKKLCSLVYIEQISDDNSELIFNFAYEYLKINTDEYFWFEWEYAFSWSDMQKLKNRPFDKCWYFKNPNSLL